MITLVFFLIGWGLLFLLLLLLPSIFNKTVTAVIAGISGILALFVIGAEMFVSWQVAAGAGFLLTVVTSFLTARRVEVLEDEEDVESGPALYEPVKRHDPEPEALEEAVEYDAVKSSEQGDLTVGDDAQTEAASDSVESETEDTENVAAEHASEDGEAAETETADQSAEQAILSEESNTTDEREGEIPRRFVVEADEEDQPSDDGMDPEEAEEAEAGASRLMHKEGDSSLTERRPLNEEDENPIMRRSSSIDVEEFSQDTTEEDGTEHEQSTSDKGQKETPVTDPHDVNEKRKRLFEALADEDDKAGGQDK